MSTAAREHGDRADSVTINLRASREMRELIDHAAGITKRTRTEFMLDAARRAAEDALLDQRLFMLDDAAWDRFVAALDAPAQPSAALRKLLTQSPPWDR